MDIKSGINPLSMSKAFVSSTCPDLDPFKEASRRLQTHTFDLLLGDLGDDFRILSFTQVVGNLTSLEAVGTHMQLVVFVPYPYPYRKLS
jgi:hypothetical protein